MIKILVYTADRIADVRSGLNDNEIQHVVLAKKSLIARAVACAYGKNVVCVRAYLENVSANNIIETKLAVGSSKGSAKLIGVMDDPTNTIETAAVMAFMLFHEGGDFKNKLNLNHCKITFE